VFYDVILTVTRHIRGGKCLTPAGSGMPSGVAQWIW